MLRIDEKFSAKAFEELGLDSDGARQLANSLKQEIEEELHSVIESAVIEMIGQLNEIGHHLQSYQGSGPTVLAYRDCSKGDCEHGCKLRVAVDFFVSTGYAHLIFPD